MKRRLSVIVFSLILIITACSSNVQSEDLMRDISQNDVVEECEVAVDDADISDFTLRLLRASNIEGENVLLSPMSILCALGMTANGAKEETLEQIEEVLGIPVFMLNNYIYGYMKVLPENEHCKLNLANSIWVTDDGKFTANPTFLQLNADYYDADLYQTPFDHSTIKDINNWVKKETSGMIPEILDRISQEAVMYLVNALAFESEWEEIYEKKQVREGTFTTEDGEKQTVDFMYHTEGYYLEDDNAKGFVKFYKDSSYAFVALLPVEGISISDYIDTLDGEKLHDLLANRQADSVKTSIPKFESQYSIELSNVLSEMGMPDAFDEERADFSGIGTYGEGNIYIGRVLHKTYISVGAKGTKAGAATLIEMNAKGTAAMLEQKTVYLNRPFVYMLVQCSTNVPFFIGTMMNVNQ